MNRLLTTTSVLNAAGEPEPYVQNRVSTSGAFFEGNSGGYHERPYLEFSVWFNPLDFIGGKGFFGFGLDTQVYLLSDGRFEFRMENLSNVRIFEMISNESLSSGVLQHIYFAYDYRNGTWELKVDGVDFTGTPSTGPASSGSGSIQFNKTFNALSEFGDGGALYGELGDFWLDNPDELLGYPAFHELGQPKDLSSLVASENPAIFLGGSMVAADWESASQLGNLALTKSGGAITDA